MASKKYTLILGLLSLFSSVAYSQRNDAMYDWRDSSKIATKDLPQHNEFSNNQYPYPAKPRSQWELGLHGGSPILIGDVSPQILQSFAGGLSLRKAISHTFSVRGGYTFSLIKGVDYRTKTGASIIGTANPDPWRAYYGQNTPFVPNYRTMVMQGTIDLITSLNPASHYRGNPKTNAYILLGYSYLAADADVNVGLKNGNNLTRFNYAPVFAGNQSLSRKDIRERIKAISGYQTKDGTGKGPDTKYESNAAVTNGQRSNALPFKWSSKNWFFRHAYSFGFGNAWKLSNKVNIALEQRFTKAFTDDLDGLNVGRSNDILSYTSGRININIGSSSKKVQPLWWLNPNNYIYNEVNAPQHMKLPKPILPDADGDGVTDQFDMEPNTPQGAPVDVRGVSRDTDGDGVPDYKDKELLTSQKCFPVDADGVGNCPEPACCKELRDLIASGSGHPPMTCAIGNLPSVQFRSGTSLSKDAQSVLESAASQIKANPTCKIKVTGHGASDKRAQQLSWDRVNAVIRYLVERQGIAEDRFIFTYGEEGDAMTVDLMGTSEEGPNTVPAPHPNLRKG